MNMLSLPSINTASLPRVYEAAQAVDEATRKAIWIADARFSFSPGKRQPCLICGKWEGIAQAHHLFPLAQQYDDGIGEPDQSFAWLCPNHHAAVHLLMSQIGGKRVGVSAAVGLLLTETYERGEMQALLDLAVHRFPDLSCEAAA